MNLQHLEYLIEIENCGSISKAARRLFVTQPYLSRILKEVESEYGITVFTREKTGITPTDSGRLFLDMARDLLDDAGNFQRIFRERADHYRLRVSACTCSHPNDAFIRMVKSIPDIPLRFSYRESSPRIVIGDVYSNRADVGVLMYLAHTRSQIEELLSFRHLEEHFLFSSRAQLFCREDHPILKEKDSLTMEKICQYNFALYPVEAGNARALESVYNNMDLNFIQLEPDPADRLCGEPFRPPYAAPAHRLSRRRDPADPGPGEKLSYRIHSAAGQHPVRRKRAFQLYLQLYLPQRKGASQGCQGIHYLSGTVLWPEF